MFYNLLIWCLEPEIFKFKDYTFLTVTQWQHKTQKNESDFQFTSLIAPTILKLEKSLLNNIFCFISSFWLSYEFFK